MGVSGFLLKAMGSQILAFQCDRVFACSVESNACHDKSICGFWTCSVCLLMMRSECVWAFGEGSNFQLEGLKLSFKAFLSRSSLTQTFVESCVDFEVAHLSVLMVHTWRFLP